MSATDAFHMPDPELPSYSCPDVYPNFFNPFYLSGAHRTTTSTTYPSYDPHSATTATTSALPSGLAKPHDDLSHFFADSPFSSPTPNHHYAPLKPQTNSPTPWAAQEGGWNNKNKNNQDSATTTGPQVPLAILTSGFQPGDSRTVVHQIGRAHV